VTDVTPDQYDKLFGHIFEDFNMTDEEKKRKASNASNSLQLKR
jgi:hypothetical protein